MVQVKQIVSKDNPLLVRLRKLAGDPTAYRRFGELWIEGEHLCAAFVKRGGVATRAVLSQEAWDDDRMRVLGGRADSVVLLPQALMATVSTLESAAPLGFCIPWPGPGQVQAGQPTVVLDRVQDAGNVGSVLRCAAAFGFSQVVALAGTAALWSPKVLRAGMGAHFALNLIEGLAHDALSGLGVPILGTSSHAAQAIHEVPLPWPCAWVLGNEGQGVSAEVLQAAQETLRIPQPGGEESLNVAAAAAVTLYESVRQRMAASEMRKP
jgi:TrmH family RNA methyltransferase